MKKIIFLTLVQLFVGCTVSPNSNNPTAYVGDKMPEAYKKHYITGHGNIKIYKVDPHVLTYRSSIVATENDTIIFIIESR